jgi:hypothetical protein
MSASNSSQLTLLRAIALLLFFAAGAKAVAAIRGSEAKLILLAESACEAALAAWLASGSRPRQSLRVAIGVFVLFAIVSATKLSLGSSSCGCFGVLQVPPAITYLLDLCIIILLLLTSPDEPFLGPSFFQKMIFATCVLLIGLAIFTVAWQSHYQHSPHPVEIFPTTQRSN